MSLPCCVERCFSAYTHADKITHIALRTASATGNGSIMNTYMAFTSPADDNFFSTRHSHILSPPASPSSTADVQPTLLWDPSPDSRASPVLPPCLVRGRYSPPYRTVSQPAKVPSDAGHNAVFHPFPSPPLTDGSLRSTIPLPEFHQYLPADCLARDDCQRSLNCSMSRDSFGFRAPLSPPPTQLLGTSELPPVDWDADVACDGHAAGSSMPLESSGAGPSKRATTAWADAEKDISYHSSSNQHCAPYSQPSNLRGWSFEGTLSELTASSVDPNVASQNLPSRGDSGFEESMPQHKSSLISLPSLSEESDTGYTKIEPTAFWAPHSPLSMHIELDDHAPHNPALLGTEYRHSSAFEVSPLRSSRSQSTPTMSWSSHDWSSGSDRDDDFSPPSSPRPKSLSLDLPDLDSFSSQDSGLRVADFPRRRPALFGLDGLDSRQQVPWFTQVDIDGEDDGLRETDFMNIDGDPPEPSSPRPPLALLLPSGDDSDDSFSDTVISPEEGPWSTSLSPTAYSDLRNTSNDPLCITPIPRPPQLHSTRSDFRTDARADSPPSPAPLTLSLPIHHSQQSSDETIAETVAPSLLSPPPEGDRKSVV